MNSLQRRWPAQGSGYRTLTAVPDAMYMQGGSERPIPYLETFWRKKWFLALCLVAGVGLVTALLWRTPYIYQAQALLEVQGVNANVLNSREVDPTATADNSSQNYINTEAKILQSGPLLDDAVRRLNAAPPDIGGQRRRPITRRELASALRVRTHEFDRIVEVSAESQDPKLAAGMANAVTSAFITREIEERFKDTQRTSEWLSVQLEEIRSKLNRSEDELLAYTKGSNLLVDGSQGSVAETKLRNVQDEMSRAQADRITKQSVFESAQKADPSTLSEMLHNNTLQQYQVQLVTLRKELAELESIYAPDYYKVVRAKAQIAELEKALSDQSKAASEQMAAEFHAAGRREVLLSEQYTQQFEHAADQGAKMVHFNALKNEVETNRKIYGEMLQKVKGFGVASAMQPSNIRVIDPADVPLTPVRPNKMLLSVAGGMAFLFIGFVAVVVQAARNRNINGPGETQQYLQTSELGVIPSAGSLPRLNPTQQLPSADVPTRAIRGFRSGRTMPELETVTWSCSDSLLAASFRSIGASLLLSKAGRFGSQVLVVTSLQPADGKTSVTSNVGIAMAGASNRVLLIDGDARRARLHSVFGQANSGGLSDLLRPPMAGDVLNPADYIVPTGIPDLSLLPSGTSDHSVTDLFYSKRLEALITYLRSDFDVILIDAPPLTHLPDARILGRVSDGVILVLRAGKVSWESAMAAEQRLRDDGTPIAGTVLNDWDPKTSSSGMYPYDKRVYSYFSS